MEYKEIKNILKDIEKSSRFKHTMGVVETAEHLAKIYGYDEKKAKLAALLHDCAKHLTSEEKIQMCQEHRLEISDAERRNPALLHAKCGAILAQSLYGIEDPEILHAIAVHTTGSTQMNLLDKIIFVSDYIEPGRDKAPRLKELRKLADKDLDLSMFYIMEDTVSYLEKYEKQSMDPTTYQAYLFYKTVIESRCRKENKEKKHMKENISREMAKIACHALSEKKAEDIQVIDIAGISVIADYFVIASASNANQLQAMMDAVGEDLYKAGYTCAQTEGNQRSSWILMDYKDIIVHLFSKEDRLFYDLERIWQDGKFIAPEEL